MNPAASSAPFPADASLRGIWALYRRSFPYLWLPSLLLALAYAGVSRHLDAITPDLDSLDDLPRLTQFLWSGALWAPLLWLALATLWLYGAMLAGIVAASASGAPPGFAASPALLAGLRAWPVACLAAGLALAMMSIGTLLFVIPGVYIGGMLQLWLVPVIVQRAGPVAALRTSWRLVAGSWWRVNTIVSVALLVALLASALLGALGDLVLWLLAPLVGSAGGASAALRFAIPSLANFLVAPLLPVTLAALYGELSARRR